MKRALERLDLDGRLRPVRGILAAQQVKPQARVLAAVTDAFRASPVMDGAIRCGISCWLVSAKA